MLYVHEQNMVTKIKENYSSVGDEIKNFYYKKYLPFRNEILQLKFSKDNYDSFEIATELINNYIAEINDFSTNYGIKSQSKFASTFLEEISSYLFKDIEELKNDTYGVFNKGIYAGLKIEKDNKIAVIKKDVDFCIGKRVNVIIDNQDSIDITIPIVAVEVKTYLDATMFGEIKSSSKAIRSASPNSRTYVLMGYKDLADEHIISARQDSTLNEMFALKKDKNSPIESKVLYAYWEEITNAINSITTVKAIETPGKLLFP